MSKTYSEEDGDALIAMLDVTLTRLEHLVLETESRSTSAHYRRIIEALRLDNEKLYRENILLKDRLRGEGM